MNLGEFDYNFYENQKSVIIYGAGVYGEYVYMALKHHNIRPTCFCDRAKSGKSHHGLPIYDYTYIKSLDHPIILLAVGAQYVEVANFLDSNGIDYYDIYELCFVDTSYDEEELTAQTKDIEYYKSLLHFGKKYGKANDSLSLFSVDWVITERCSLRCRDCSNLMQYYQHPENKKKEALLTELTALSNACDKIMDVRIIGGEPFMHPAITDILTGALKIDNIHNFSIYTNATILPSYDMLQLMKDKRVKCEISDYGSLAKNFPRFIDLMESNHIRHHIVKVDEWHKLGGLINHNRSVEAMKSIFSNCYCNDLITLLDGKLYRCPYSAHGRNLEAIPYKKSDVVDIFNTDTKMLKTELKQLVFEKEYDLACSYCDGRNYHLATVKPAIQTSKPLEYERITQTNEE